MNKKEILATATFVVFYTGFIWTGFGWMLSSKTESIKAEVKAEIAPIRAEIAPIKENQARVESEIKVVKVELNNRMDRLETRMDRMEERIGLEMQEIKSMLGQILIAQNTHHKGKSVGKFKKPSKAKPAPRKTASQ